MEWFYVIAVISVFACYALSGLVFVPNLKKKFSGKSVIITGASSGLGEELALQISKYKPKLTLAARNIEKLKEVKKHCTELGAESVVIVRTDVGDTNQCRDLVTEATKAHGGVDIVIANAGIGMAVSLRNLQDTSVIEQVMKVDFFGAMNVAFWALPELRKTHGHITVISSVYAKIPAKGVTGYCAAKHALHGFFDSLRLEEKRNRINVTMICPGYIRTPIHDGSLTGDGKTRGSHEPDKFVKLTEVSVGKAATWTLEATAANKFQLVFPFMLKVIVFLRGVLPGPMDKFVFGA